MKEKEEVGQETKAANDKLAEAEVGSPYEQLLKEEKVEKGEPEKEVEEPEDQSERSKLGRRVRRVEDSLTTILSKLDSALERREPNYHIPSSQQTSSSFQDDVPEVITTYDDFKKAQKKYRDDETKEQKKYEENYFRKLDQLRTENSDLHQEVVDEMMANFNVKHSGDASVDAELNYSKAYTSLLKKKVGVIKPKVRGEKSSSSTNLSVESRETSATSSEPQLDEFAKEFVSKVGMDGESVKRALGGEVPPHLYKTK
jgi:hypothetical protein